MVLIVQLEEHCIGIAGAMGSNPVLPECFFYGITAMINHVFISFSAVQIYDLSYIHLYVLSVLFPPKLLDLK